MAAHPRFEGWLYYSSPKKLFSGGWKKKWVVLEDFECKCFNNKVPSTRDANGKPIKSDPNFTLQSIKSIVGGAIGKAKTNRDNGIYVVVSAAGDKAPTIYNFATENAAENKTWVENFLTAQKHALDHYKTKYFRLRMIAGRQLKALDSGGTSDPYVLADVGGTQYKTQQVLKTLTPEWNETAIWILASQQIPATVSVFDWNRIGADVAIGSIVLNLSQMPSDAVEKVAWHTLVSPDHSPGAGEIQLGITLGGFQSSVAEVDPVMDFYLKYVKRGADGKMIVQNLPEAWAMLFAKAGVNEEQLKDPNIISNLVKVLHDALKNPSQLDAAPSGKPPRQKVICVCTAAYDFTPQVEGDLGFKAGETIRVFEQGENGWWRGKIGDREGTFPGNYVENIKTTRKGKKNIPARPDKPAPAPPGFEPPPPTEPAPEPPTPGGDMPKPPETPAPLPPSGSTSSPTGSTSSPSGGIPHHVPPNKPIPAPPSSPLPPIPTTPAPTPTPTATPTATPTTTVPPAPTVVPPAPTVVPPAPSVVPPAPTMVPPAPTAKVPPPPPPPPPAPSGGAESSSGRSGMLNSITAFDRSKLKKADSTTNAGGRDLADLDDSQLNSLVGLLSNAIQGRRVAIKEEGSDDDDDDDEWE